MDTFQNDTPAQEKKLDFEHIEGHGSPTPAGHVALSGRQFGTVRGFDEAGKHILIPQPSDSPDDPLNWSKPFKNYIAVLVCSAVLACGLTGAGPSIAIVPMAIEFTGLPPQVAKTAYFFTSTALCNGVGLFLWVPFAEKYGRRIAYIACLVLYLATLFWCGFAKSYASMVTARIVLGLASGCGECLGALTITDIFFVHERGTMMAYYNVFLACGAAIGLITDGAITQHLGWRYIYHIDAAIVGALLIAVYFTFPETVFPIRNELMMSGHQGQLAIGGGTKERVIGKAPVPVFSVKPTVCTQESFWLMVVRPLGVVFLPAVMYSTLVFSVTIGFLVAVTSNVAPAYGATFGFSTQATGFLFFGGLIGSLIGIPLGGQLGDWCADRFARANNGIREPEHRLPAMIPAIITGPLALILYGLCIEKKLHWMVGCVGVSLINLTICAATNITLVYSIDCYKPIAGEVVTATLGFKAIIGFVLGFYTNTWVEQQGYLPAYGQMAAISAFFLLLTLPMWWFGKRLRQSSAEWRLLRWTTQWSDDRDDVQVE